jgi:hypothetical protein
MASLDKLPPTGRYPKGRNKVRYKKPDVTVGSRNFVRRDEAVRFQQANGADIDRGDWIDPGPGAASSTAALSRMSGAWSDLPQPRHAAIASTSTTTCCPFFAGWPIASIDYPDVEDFIGHLFEKKDPSGNPSLSRKI